MIQLRPITCQDASLLTSIHALSMEPAWTESEFLSLLQNPCYGGWLAIVDGDAVGFIMVSLVPPEAEILTFAVLPERRRRHIGLRLLQHFLAACEPGIHYAFLEVDCFNQPAIHLYKKVGFHEVGVRKNYYQYSPGSFSDALVMRLENLSNRQ